MLKHFLRRCRRPIYLNNTISYKEVIEEKGFYIATPIGISMYPLIRQRIDTVKLIKVNRKIQKYDVIMYQRPQGQLCLHRVIGKNNDGYILCGDNQWYKECGIKDEMIIALMEGIYRKEKYVSCNHFFYRMYSIIWVSFRWLRKLTYYIKRVVQKVFNHKGKKDI